MKVKSICTSHLDDRFLVAFINEHGTQGCCDYCQEDGIVVGIDDLAEFIEAVIRQEYDDPYNQGVPTFPEATSYEDMFPGLTISSTTEVLEDELDVDDFKIIEDLSKFIDNDFWCDIDSMWGPTTDEYLKVGWDEFKTILKYKVRFLFFNESFKDVYKDEYEDYLNPYLVLPELVKIIKELDLYQSYSAGWLTVFRSRQHDSKLVANSAYRLGSPPEATAKANRMSPPGISMFYGAMDSVTCMKEKIDLSWKNSVLTTGTFTNLVDLVLIDFTKITKVPSIFDVRFQGRRPIIKFLLSFCNDLSIPVVPDETVHIEYIPTQVVTEYIKVFLGSESKVAGFIYNSVKNPGGKCTVLFIPNDEITDKYPELINPEPGEDATTGNLVKENAKDLVFKLQLNNKSITHMEI